MRLFLCWIGICILHRTILIYHLDSEGILVCHNIGQLVSSDNKGWECTVMSTLLNKSIFMEVTRDHNVNALILATLSKVLPSVTTTVPRVLGERNVRNDNSIGCGLALLALQNLLQPLALLLTIEVECSSAIVLDIAIRLILATIDCHDENRTVAECEVWHICPSWIVVQELHCMVTTSIVVASNKVELGVIVLENLLNMREEFVEVALLIREGCYHIAIEHHKILILDALQSVELAEKSRIIVGIGIYQERYLLLATVVCTECIRITVCILLLRECLLQLAILILELREYLILVEGTCGQALNRNTVNTTIESETEIALDEG